MSFAEIKRLQDELAAKMQTDGPELFKQEVDKLFKLIPDLESIKWTQFTPYFNDGEACEFGVNEPEFKVKNTLGFYCLGKYPHYSEPENLDSLDEDSRHRHNGDHDDGHFPADEFNNYTVKNGYSRVRHTLTSEQINAMKDFSTTLQHQKEVMLAVFKDHVKVTVTKCESPYAITVDDYGHD